MNTKRITDYKSRLVGGCLAALMAISMFAVSPNVNAQTAAANLSPDLQEIVKFAQSHMSDDVILAYIKNSGKVYALSGDDMIYLTSQGVSQPVLSALLQTKSAAGAVPAPAPVSTPPPGTPAPAPVPAFAPSPAPAPVYAPPPGLMDAFNADAGLNPSVWMTQTPLLQSLAQWNGAAYYPTMLAFGPSGMQMSGVNGPAQFVGVQSVAAYTAPFSLTTTVTGLAGEGIPFDVYLVSPDLRQYLSVAGHLGGMGAEGPRGGIGIRTPFGGARIPFGGGHGPSPEYGVWVNWTGSGQPLSMLGSKIYPAPIPSVPYTITLTVGADGMASVSLQDPSGVTLGALNAMPVGAGPFNVVLASRKMGPTFASWQNVQLTPLGAPPMAVATAPPEVPTLDYFQAHLGPYGQWVYVPSMGASAWVPAEANIPGWRPYMDAGHWEYTDAGWFWQSDYPWGDIAFHYGRWMISPETGGRWGWVPGYDWAPSWVSWREGDGGMGWAPLPWGVGFRAGVGLWWHGGPVGVGIDFGLGFDAFCFVDVGHFWGGDYHRFAFDHDRARIFFEHSTFHAGYRMEGGHFRAEGLGRDHIAAITHHEVVEHRASEMRHAEEAHNFAKRNEEHHEIAKAVAHNEAAHASQAHNEPGRTSEAGHPSMSSEKPGTTSSTHSGFGTQPGSSHGSSSSSKSSSSNSNEKKPQNH